MAIATDPGTTVSASVAQARRAWPWPLPALAGWLLAWAAWWGLARCGVAAPLAAAGACGVGALLAAAWPGLSLWRRGLLALGYPASALALGLGQGAGSGLASGLPAWAWLLPLGLLLLAYPIKAWRDAPLFPTPMQALQGLAAALPLPAGARVLDVGCGLGHGLAALRSQWPQARLHGIEWSWPLALAARLRCRRAGLQAQVRQGDMWRASWAGLHVVYLFQRPESMLRAWHKAQAELAPGAWLLSLEFEVPGVPPSLRLVAGPGRWLWGYQVGSCPGRSGRAESTYQPDSTASASTLPATGR